MAITFCIYALFNYILRIKSLSRLTLISLKVFGGNSEEVTPVPIPNTAVKLFSADGTAWEAAWESRSPPNHI